MTAKEVSAWREKHRAEIKDYKDFPKEHFVHLTPEGIQSARDSKRLRETAEVGLLLKGKQSLGDQWFVQNCPKRMLGRG